MCPTHGHSLPNSHSFGYVSYLRSSGNLIIPEPIAQTNSKYSPLCCSTTLSLLIICDHSVSYVITIITGIFDQYLIWIKTRNTDFFVLFSAILENAFDSKSCYLREFFGLHSYIMSSVCSLHWIMSKNEQIFWKQHKVRFSISNWILWCFQNTFRFLQSYFTGIIVIFYSIL